MSLHPSKFPELYMYWLYWWCTIFWWYLLACSHSDAHSMGILFVVTGAFFLCQHCVSNILWGHGSASGLSKVVFDQQFICYRHILIQQQRVSMLSKWLVVNWLTPMDNRLCKCIKQTSWIGTQVDTLMMTWITLVNTGQHWLTHWSTLVDTAD